MKTKTDKNKKGSVLGSSNGFTIIEVLIVLAIAGLIMLVVFLAVPALQRNSRNTQRRNDVASYLGAVNEFVANNNGQLPSDNDDVTTINDLANLGFLEPPTSVDSGAQSSEVDIDAMQLVSGARCDESEIGDTLAGSSRQIAVRFSVEDSTGGAVPQCQEG
ncbi:MAG: type II secretion system protein [Candidatus Saccharibacteria bacterium]|nr:type II secretion system protein [Candidatus Saccharibacteria bacterium]